MRVEQNNLTDQVSSTAGRAAESQRIQVDTAASSKTGAAMDADRVDLSGLAGRIAHTMQALSSRSLQRLAHLRQDFQAGRYQPDAQQIAQALVR